mmetsp:Transcript_38506/g.87499  ORF Transcript_38506/g.87499 Transcript_38506/m.87499 type:complete len:269 (-) Transcript_38506:656-1462(-)
MNRKVHCELLPLLAVCVAKILVIWRRELDLIPGLRALQADGHAINGFVADFFHRLGSLMHMAPRGGRHRSHKINSSPLLKRLGSELDHNPDSACRLLLRFLKLNSLRRNSRWWRGDSRQAHLHHLLVILIRESASFHWHRADGALSVVEHCLLKAKRTEHVAAINEATGLHQEVAASGAHDLLRHFLLPCTTCKSKSAAQLSELEVGVILLELIGPPFLPCLFLSSLALQFFPLGFLFPLLLLFLDNLLIEFVVSLLCTSLRQLSPHL